MAVSSLQRDIWGVKRVGTDVTNGLGVNVVQYVSNAYQRKQLRPADIKSLKKLSSSQPKKTYNLIKTARNIAIPQWIRMFDPPHPFVEEDANPSSSVALKRLERLTLFHRNYWNGWPHLEQFFPMSPVLEHFGHVPVWDDGNTSRVRAFCVRLVAIALKWKIICPIA